MNVLLLAQTDVVGSATPDLLPSVGRMLFGLVVVLGLLGGLAWLLRRGVAVRRKSGTLGIESTLALGDRRSLLVVSVDGRRLLLGLSPNNVALVTELAAVPPFDAAMTQALGQETKR